MKFRLALAVVLLFPFPSHVPMKPSSHGLTRPILLPKRRWEFEQWVTSRWEKEHGTYSVLDFREELEYGLTDDFQIALAVGLNSDGSVKQIEVMEYRETYGGEIRNEKWRAQFVGKTIRSTLKLDSDIKNISRATF